MQRRLLNLTFGILAVGLIPASPGWAQRAGNNNNIAMLSKSFQSMAYNPAEDSRRNVIRELLSSESPALQMPPFPRVWYQAERGEQQDSNTSIGLSPSYGVSFGGVSFGGIGVTGKVSINYSYSRRHFLVVMMSTRQASTAAKVSENPLSDLSDITRFDPTTQRRFFNAKPDFPMVGFCAYEMSLKIARNAEGAIFFPGLNESRQYSNYQAETITLYSNFFQIEPHVPMIDYLDQKCGGVFLKEARPFVENDFNKIILEYYANYHPSNNCRLGGEASAAGDHNCLAWFSQFDSVTQNRFIPRCLQQDDGTAKCSLRTKAGMGCSMYLGPNGQLTEQYTRYREAVVTQPDAHPCDQNLRCTLERPPKMIGSLILWPGTARCR